MKKEQLITASYLLFSVGLFALAIEMWICGAEPFCRQSNSVVSNIAKAAINVSVPEYSGTGWSGPANPNFAIQMTGSTAVNSISINNDGDDGDSDGH